MPDNVLSFTTQVDLSGLKSGMAEVQSTVQSTASTFSGTYKDALNAAKLAADNLASAEQQLGKNTSVPANIEILKQYQNELAQANAAVTKLSLTQQFSARQISEFKAAQAKATNISEQADLEAARAAELLALQNDIVARSYNGRTSATTRNTSATAGNIGASQAAAGELRVLEGSVMGATRAAGSFLATIPGVGAALQSAFAVFGIIALGEIVVDVGQKIYEAFDLGGERARKLQQDILGLNDAFAHSNTELDVQIDKLQQEEAHLKGLPFDGTKLALDEAANAAQDLNDKLDGTIKRLESILKTDYEPSSLQKILQSQQGTGDIQVILEQHSKWLSQATTQQDKLNETKRTEVVLQQKLNDLTAQQTAAPKALPHTPLGALQEAVRIAESPATGGETLRKDFSPEIAGAKEAIAALKAHEVEIQKNIDLGKQMAKTQKARDAHADTGLENKAAAAERKAREQQLQAIESSFSDKNLESAKITGHPLTSGEAASFWNEYITTFAAKSEEYKHVQDEVAKYTEEIHKTLSGEIKKYNEDQGKSAMGNEADQAIYEIARQRQEDARKAAEEAKKAADDLRKQQEEAAQSTHEANLGGIQQKEAGIESQQQLGIIDPKVALQQLQDLHLQEEEEERFIAAMKIIDAGQVEDQKRLQKELEDSQRKSQLQQMKDTTKILAQEESEYRKAFSLITNDFNNALLQWQTHETTASQAFSKMLLSMETGVEKLVLQFIEGQLEKELLKLLTSMLGISSASTSNVNQTQLNSDKVVNPQIVESNAAAAASVVFLTSGGDIAAALEAYAAGMIFYPLASYETGGIVGGSHGMPVPIMAHAGERVLSAPQTQNFERMVNQPAKGGGSSVHVNYSPNINAFDRSGWRSMLAANKGDIVDLVRQAVKTGALG